MRSSHTAGAVAYGGRKPVALSMLLVIMLVVFSGLVAASPVRPAIDVRPHTPRDKGAALDTFKELDTRHGKRGSDVSKRDVEGVLGGHHVIDRRQPPAGPPAFPVAPSTNHWSIPPNGPHGEQNKPAPAPVPQPQPQPQPQTQPPSADKGPNPAGDWRLFLSAQF